IGVAGREFARPPSEPPGSGQLEKAGRERRTHDRHVSLGFEQSDDFAQRYGAAANHETQAPLEIERHRIPKRAHPVVPSVFSGRGKKCSKRSSTWGSSSQGMSSRILTAARGSRPPRPPTKT